MLRSCFLSNFFESRSAVSEESKMSQPIMGHGAHLFCTDRPETHKLVRRRWDLASCQVSLNSVQQFQRISRKCLSQSKARAAILFSDQPEKHKLGRGRWDLASCQLSLNSVRRFQRRSWKCESLQTDGRRRTDGQRTVRYDNSSYELKPCLNPISPKNTNLLEDVEILLPVKFRWIPFSGFREEVENVSANQRPGRPSYFSDQPEKHKLGRGLWDLASCQVSLNSVQRFQRRSRKFLSQSEARVAILFFRSARKTQTW